MMLIGTQGQQHRAAELRDILESAGFTDVQADADRRKLLLAGACEEALASFINSKIKPSVILRMIIIDD